MIDSARNPHLRKKYDRIVLLALEQHGPLTDAQLAWWLTHFGAKPSTTLGIRRRLTEQNKIRFAGKLRLVAPGRYAQLWEKTL